MTHKVSTFDIQQKLGGKRAARLHLLAMLDRQRGDLSQEQADRLANEAKHRTRKLRLTRRSAR